MLFILNLIYVNFICLRMPKEDMVAVLQDLKESPHRRLDVTNEMKVKTEYKRIVGKSPDPYKR